MPINTTSPVASKALSVASKKLYLSPVAWPSIRTNSSLAASSLLQHWWPHCNSMKWIHKAYDERPQCRASKQYSALVTLLDLRRPSSPETSIQSGIVCDGDVDVANGYLCTANEFENDQDAQDETNGIKQTRLDIIAANDGGFTQVGKTNEICARPFHGNRHLNEPISSDPASRVLPTETNDTGLNSCLNRSHMNEGVTQEQKLGTPDSRKNTPASPHPSTALSYALVANPAIALNLARYDFESTVERLERRCFELFVENQKLKLSAEKAKASHAKTQELNLRLGREVQQARRETTAVTEHLRQSVKMAQKTAVRSERSRGLRHQSTQTSPPLGIGVVCNTIDAMGKTHQGETINLPSLPATGGDFVSFYPPGLESNSTLSTHIASQEDGNHCRCDESYGWGCLHHRTYSSHLLLAHRHLQLAIARGPPGLELPSDKLAQANLADLGIHVARVAPLMSSSGHSLAEACM